MNRKKKFDTRCSTCQMRKELCICPEIEAAQKNIKIKTRVVILMHNREKNSTTNTGRLAKLSLPDCEIRIRGLKDQSTTNQDLVSDSERIPLLLFPSERAIELSTDYVSTLTKPVTLIVPDGSWRQASKVAKREKDLLDLTHVTLPNGKDSLYQLRREPKRGGLATFEAIARALGFLESKEVEDELEKLFLIMVKRTLNSRKGLLTKE